MSNKNIYPLKRFFEKNNLSVNKIAKSGWVNESMISHAKDIPFVSFKSIHQLYNLIIAIKVTYPGFPLDLNELIDQDLLVDLATGKVFDSDEEDAVPSYFETLLEGIEQDHNNETSNRSLEVQSIEPEPSDSEAIWEA